MKSNKEARMELEEVAREMLLIFQGLANAENHKKEILEFVDAKDRFNTLLADMAKQEINLQELLEELSNGKEGVSEVGKVVLSRTGNCGVLCIVFGDGEIWAINELTFKPGPDKSQPELPSNLLS